jgi:DNA replication protein DnaC
MLFQLVSRRYQSKSTLITTNRPFAEWNEVFPNAACVVSLVDRLVHNAEIIAIEGESYRLKEARDRAEQRASQRRRTKS